MNNSALNSPVPYAAAAAGLGVGQLTRRGAWQLYGARLTQLAAYLLVVAAAIRIAPSGKPFLFALGLLPSSLMLAGTVSADPAALSLAILATAAVLHLRERPTSAWRHRLLVVVAVSLVLLALSKNLYVVMAGLALLVPPGASTSARARRWYRLGVPLAAVAAAGAWALAGPARIHFTSADGKGIDSVAQAAWIRGHPLAFAQAAWRGLTDPSELRFVATGLVTLSHRSNLGVPSPIALVPAGLLVLLGAILVDRRAAAVPAGSAGSAGSTTRWSWAFVALCSVVVSGLIVLGESLTFNPVAPKEIHWFQGRYLLPLLPLLLLPAAVRPARPVAKGRVLGAVVTTGTVLLLVWFCWESAALYR